MWMCFLTNENVEIETEEWIVPRNFKIQSPNCDNKDGSRCSCSATRIILLALAKAWKPCTVILLARSGIKPRNFGQAPHFVISMLIPGYTSYRCVFGRFLFTAAIDCRHVKIMSRLYIRWRLYMMSTLHFGFSIFILLSNNNYFNTIVHCVIIVIVHCIIIIVHCVTLIDNYATVISFFKTVGSSQ